MKWGSGHVFTIDRKRGPVWYAKYRTPQGRQVQRLIGPAWSGRDAAPQGFYTKRSAEAWLRARLEDMHRGVAAGMVETGATFADAAQEYLRFVAEDKGAKPSTITNYRSAINAHLLPAFGRRRIEDITTQDIERWRSGLEGANTGSRAGREISNKTKNNLLVLMHAIFRRAVKVWGLPFNPVSNVDRFRVRSSGDIQVFSTEEIWSLVRAAWSEKDGAIFLTAAFTGLRRGELLALRWRDIDFTSHAIRVRASYAGGQLTTPKSGKVRSVPMAPDVASALARLGQREEHVGGDDFVFAGDHGLPLDGSALSKRYDRALEAAGVRRLRFHDLRHTFGTTMIRRADILKVKTWMGHADIQTTMKYLHYQSQAEDAELVADAFGGRTGVESRRS